MDKDIYKEAGELKQPNDFSDWLVIFMLAMGVFFAAQEMLSGWLNALR